MNNISFIGNIVANAEVALVGGTNCIKIRVANNVGFGDKKTTNWFGVSMFRNGDVTKFAGILEKGKQVFVTGEFKARPYKDKNGVDQVSLDIRATDINLIGGRGDDASSGNASGGSAGQSAVAPPAQNKSAESSPVSTDDMPF